MKVIFLDVDGVLSPIDSMKERVKEWGYTKSLPPFELYVDPVMKENVDYILGELPDTHIVISSSHRYWYSLKDFVEVLGQKVIDVTPRIQPCAKAIMNWLSHHDVEDWIVIDDDIVDLGQERIMNVSKHEGLHELVAKDVVERLK